MTRDVASSGPSGGAGKPDAGGGSPGDGPRRGTTIPPPPPARAPLWPRVARDFQRLRQVKERGFWIALFDAVLLDSGFQALLAHRLAHTLLSWRVPVLPAVCRRWAIGACGVDILPRAEIGGGCIIAHGVGLVVGGYTVIGEDCTLLHGATLGEARFDELDYPRVGDRVTISAGALVLGGVTIGDDATIAAGSVVIGDVPAGATVAGVPARVIRSADGNDAAAPGAST
jgi:serine O-acetyltransferase